MNERSKRNAVLASVGLLVLGIYILACTSFSPDDTKVLYPSFDTATGAIGMAVYDRAARASEMLFVPVAYEGGATNADVAPSIIRGQWLANGRNIAIACTAPDGSDNDGLTVAVVPWGTRKPIRSFCVPDIKDRGENFVVPLCLAGERAFFPTGGKTIVRLDLRTGALAAHEFEDAHGDLSFYPVPDGAGVLYFEADAPSDAKTTFGRLNPNDFSRTPLMVVTNKVVTSHPDPATVVTYDPAGKVLVFLAGDDDKVELKVWRDGRPVFSRAVDTHGQKRVFGNAVLATNGKAVRASFQQANGTNAVSYGLMEIPFSEAPVREVILIKDAPAQSDDSVYYFQVGVSHDGKTAAIASTYLALMDKPIPPPDCALFLVDLNAPNWKATKVPIPVPARKPSAHQ